MAACPELLAGLLLVGVLDDNEALVASGFEQFCVTRGYGDMLRLEGPCDSQTEVRHISKVLMSFH